MRYLKNFYVKNLKHDLINKFFYINIKKLPKLKKIILNFGCKATTLKILATNLLALELITNKKGFLKKAKQPNLNFKIKKGNFTGCKLILYKNLKLNFMSKISTQIFAKIKKFNRLKLKDDKNNCLSYTIKNLLNFNCLNEKYYLFNNLSNLNITIITDNNKKKQILFFFKCLQLPLLKNNRLQKQI